MPRHVPTSSLGVWLTHLHAVQQASRKRAERTGITDFDRTYSLNELASGDTVFCATGVTDGSMLSGVKSADGRVHTHTLVMTSLDGMVRYVRSDHKV